MKTKFIPFVCAGLAAMLAVSVRRSCRYAGSNFLRRSETGCQFWKNRSHNAFQYSRV